MVPASRPAQTPASRRRVGARPRSAQTSPASAGIDSARMAHGQRAAEWPTMYESRSAGGRSANSPAPTRSMAATAAASVYGAAPIGAAGQARRASNQAQDAPRAAA